jgi:hypothetical protein
MAETRRELESALVKRAGRRHILACVDLRFPSEELEFKLAYTFTFQPPRAIRENAWKLELE